MRDRRSEGGTSASRMWEWKARVGLVCSES